MTVLVTGACGLLGAHVVTAMEPGAQVVGIDRHPWWGDRPLDLRQGDLRAGRFIEEVVADVRPTVLIHCAAMVDVDACERQPDVAEAYNAGTTRMLAAAAGHDCLFVYITTDGIFQGDRPMVTELEPPRPRTAYGRSKLHGEQVVQAASDQHLIVRTNFFGWSSQRKPTSAEWLYTALATGQPITGFADFYFTPIYVADFVERLLRLIASPHRGIFHLCGAERVSKYEFAVSLAREAGFPTDAIARGSIDDAGLLAPRPKDMSLSTEKVRRALNTTLPSCVDSIRRFLSHRGVPLSARFEMAARSRGAGASRV
jgi:dTDP-4-dehydrorhamnose reductase